MKRLMVAALALVMSSAMWVAAQTQQTKPATPAAPAKPATPATPSNSGNASKAGAGSNSNAAGVCR
jgi:hypothetical protein